MKYLDMVLNESFRTFPHDEFIKLRQSIRHFQIPNSNLVIPAGTLVLIPFYLLHNDERFWENPDKFDPERFNEENLAEQTPFTFYPFGVGPRICPGVK